MTIDSALYPTEFLASIVNSYVTPKVNPVAVKLYEVTPEPISENTPPRPIFIL